LAERRNPGRRVLLKNQLSDASGILSLDNGASTLTFLRERRCPCNRYVSILVHLPPKSKALAGLRGMRCPGEENFYIRMSRPETWPSRVIALSRWEVLMDPWIKATLTLMLGGVSAYIIIARPKDRQAREYAMWLLGALMGYWLR
jgi:hypothetical protein